MFCSVLCSGTTWTLSISFCSVFCSGITWTLSINFCSVLCSGTTWPPFLVEFVVVDLAFVLLFFLFPSDVKAAASWTFGLQPCEKLWLSAFNARADNTVINYCQMFCKFKAWCLHRTREFSFLPASPISVSLYLHSLLEKSLGSSSIHSALYAINWTHKLAGFENVNPCDKFLVKSIAEASGRISRKPVRKAEPITQRSSA